MSEETSLFRFFKREHWLNKSNRWEPEADEFAVAFRLDELSGMLNTRLEIPPGTRAWALIGDSVFEYTEGEKAIEDFVERLNSGLDPKHGEVLITRKAALAVPFEFSSMHSSEPKAMDATLSLMIRVGELAAFRNHFMRRSGPVKVAHLQSLLGPALGQVVREFCITRGLKELQVTGELREQLVMLIKKAMRWHFDEYGLDFEGVETLSLDQKKSETEHRLDADAEELRARINKLDQLEMIRRTDTREAAIDMGAREEIEALEGQYAHKRHLRERETLKERWTAEDEATEWRHMRELAEIRQKSEVEAAEARAANELSLERKRCNAQLALLEAEESVRRAEFLEDAAEREACRRKETEHRDAAAARLSELEDERHQLALAEIQINREARIREAQRIEEWEDHLLKEKIKRAKIKLDHEELQGLADLELPSISGNMHQQQPKREQANADSERPGGSLMQDTSAPRTAGSVPYVSPQQLVDRHFTIKEGEVGHSYESIIGPYLAGGKSLEIDDPYIRKPYQIRNFREFCNLVARSGTVKKVTLATTYEDEDSEEFVRQDLEKIRNSLARRGVVLEFKLEPDRTFHHREIRIDNGWSIRIDKGLDIFKPPDSKSAAQPADQTLRQCELRTVSIFHREGTGRPNHSGTNSNKAGEVPLTLHVMHYRPLVIGQQTTLSFRVRNDSQAVLENVTVTLQSDETLSATPIASDHRVAPGEMAECRVALQSKGPAGELALGVYVKAEAENGHCMLAVARNSLHLSTRTEGANGQWTFCRGVVADVIDTGSNNVNFEAGVRVGEIRAGAVERRVIPEIGATPNDDNSTVIPLRRREPCGLGQRIDLGEFAADWPHKKGAHFLSLAFVDDQGKPRHGPVRDIDDKYVLRVRAGTPAYLWLFGQSSNGEFYHLFPTMQATVVRDGRIHAGRDYKYPGDLSGTEPHEIHGEATDVLGFADPGRERAMAVCTTRPLDIPGHWTRIEAIPAEDVRRLLTQAYNQAGSVLAMVDIQVETA